MPRLKEDIFNLVSRLNNTVTACDINVLKAVSKQLEDQIASINPLSVDWKDFKSFWPPRLIESYRDEKLALFFGAGLSIPAKFPNWNELLSKSLNLERTYLDDENLKNDPLTLAELARNFQGSETLQILLRKEFNKNTSLPTTSHYLCALLKLPYYITTNYDTLFEVAWKKLHPTIELITITNDSDIQKFSSEIASPPNNKSFLFKIHGCLNSHAKLILTRTDYRTHYRSNVLLFKTFKDILRSKHILFLGFSHNDLEITKLIEDIIYEYESSISQGTGIFQPNFYSLQFDMANHTPEIFAAKGIVALRPPLVSLSDDYRSEGLNFSLGELMIATQFKLNDTVSFDNELDFIKKEIELDLKKHLNFIKAKETEALHSINNLKDYAWMSLLVKSLGVFASEGLYLSNEQGQIINHETPSNYAKSSRIFSKPITSRPYFGQSVAYREPFISDSVSSVFNGNSTLFLCFPICDNGQFVGLLFSAFQVGKWKTPLIEAKKLWAKGLSVLLIDSNGKALFPPNDEFSTDPLQNDGYSYDKLNSLSLRDNLVCKLHKNIVPISKDDEVINLTEDFKIYSLVSQIELTDWKISIAKNIKLRG